VRSIAHAQREIVVSSGAIGSPKLLMVSGIGPADELRTLGIDVHSDVPGVGKNLQEHAYAPMLYGVTVPTLNLDRGSKKAQIKHGLNFVLFRRGPVTSGGVHAVVFAPDAPGSTYPECEILFAPFGVLGRAEEQKDPDEIATVHHDVHDMQLAAVAAVTVLPSVLHPKSRGTVTLRSANPADPPRIQLEMLGDPADIATLTSACRRVRAILDAPSMKPFVASEIHPGPRIDSDESFAAYFRATCFRGNHPAGTCKMGADDTAVVDPELRVRGIEGLRVVDASVMPTLISGHLNAPTVMIAERAADLIKEAS
jgi:choline dehydrogenase